MQDQNIPGATLTRVHDTLIITIHSELSLETISGIQQAALTSIDATDTAAVIVEMSAVQVIGREEFLKLKSLCKMCEILGSRPILVGLSPQVIAYLVNNDVDVSDCEGERNLDRALSRLGQAGEAEP